MIVEQRYPTMATLRPVKFNMLAGEILGIEAEDWTFLL